MFIVQCKILALLLFFLLSAATDGGVKMHQVGESEAKNSNYSMLIYSIVI